MKIPLAARMKKQAHRDIAYAQDLIIIEMCEFFPLAVLHGGTAIWRCYGGVRFSEDIDVYLPSKSAFGEFFGALEKKGFAVIKRRIKDNSLYSLLEFNRTLVRFEAIFSQKQGIVKEYEAVDGTLYTIRTLSPEQLLEEKIAACVKRRLVRDLFDVFFLLRFSTQKPARLQDVLTIAILDEKNLKTIILVGIAPSVEEMKRYIQTWEP